MSNEKTTNGDKYKAQFKDVNKIILALMESVNLAALRLQVGEDPGGSFERGIFLCSLLSDMLAKIATERTAAYENGRLANG